MSAWRVVRASAPVRIDLAGGWTDVPPFADREGGVVVNAAIDLHVTARVEPAGSGLLLVSEDLGTRVEAPSRDELVLDGRLDLLAAAVRRYGPDAGRITTRADTPAGSGLGSSGALGVALAAALARVSGEELTPPELAERAYGVEAEEAGQPGGRQDQYAAALGGFQRLTFQGVQASAQRLELDRSFAEELAARSVLCYTGTSRVSGVMIQRVMDGYTRGERGIRDALFRIRAAAEGMGDALRAGDLAQVGVHLTENWSAQQALDPGMRTPRMARLEAVLATEGVLGCKAVGAGAGGCMLFVASRSPDALRRIAQAEGAEVLEVDWTREGVRVEG